MPKITIIVGTLLELLGVVAFVMTGMNKFTALIPTGFGIVISGLGALAMKPELRKHAMHGAAALGLIGFLGGLGMGIPKLIKSMQGTPMERPAAVYSQLIMGAICAVFLVLCVQSFIAARRARESQPV